MGNQGTDQLQVCMWCFHAIHARGQKCGVLFNAAKPPKVSLKTCKCKAGAHWWDGIGNAIGESLFGGDR